MTRVLVLGATGMLGHAAVRSLADRFEIEASVRDMDRAYRYALPARLHAFDASDADGLPGLLDAATPDVALNCIGIVKQHETAGQPVAAITINALFPHVLAEACADRDIWLIHVSTDCVFGGTLRPPARYREDDLPDARDLYGRSKLLGEIVDPPSLTLRTSIIGRELERANGLLEWFLAQPGPGVPGFANAVFSGLTTMAFSNVIGQIIDEHPQLTGLYHVSSEPITKYQLLVLLNEAFTLGHHIQELAEPHVNRALDGTRFRAATGIDCPSWETMISEYAKELAA